MKSIKIKKFDWKTLYKPRINFTKLFNKYKNEIENESNKYNKLKLSFNKKNIKKCILFNKIKLYYDKDNILNFIENKKKKRNYEFSFILDDNSLDSEIYSIWSKKPSYLKYIYSKIYRKSKWQTIYNYIYRSILFKSFWLIIKPSTIILKNFFFRKNFFIFEYINRYTNIYFKIKETLPKWKNKEFNLLNSTKLFLLFYYNKIIKIKNIETYKYQMNWLKKKHQKKLFRNKLKLLFFYNKRWLTYHRNNWKIFISWKNFFTLRYKKVLFDLFNLKNFYKFKKIINRFKNAIKDRKIEEIRNNKIISNHFLFLILKHKWLINRKINSHIFKKKRRNNLKNLTLNKNSFFFRMYFLYFFWFLNLFKNLTIVMNKILLNFWLSFLFFLKLNINVDLKKINNKFKLLYNNSPINNLYIPKILLNLYYFDDIYLIKLQKTFFFPNQQAYIDHVINYIYNNNYNDNFEYYFYNFIYFFKYNLINWYFNGLTKINRNFNNIILDYNLNKNYVFFLNYKNYFLMTYRSLRNNFHGTKLYKNLKFYDNMIKPIRRVNFIRLHLGFNNLLNDLYILKTLHKEEHKYYADFEVNKYYYKKLYFL